MSLLSSMIDIKDRKKLEEIQRGIFSRHGRASLEEDLLGKEFSDKFTDSYFENDKNFSPNDKENLPARGVPDRADVARIGETGAIRILERLVDDLKTTTKKLNPKWTLDSICFGLVPAGGLDAHAMSIDEKSGKYAVLIPEGMFGLTNLFQKLVTLLQPISGTRDGFYYPPMASFKQFGLINHPYIKFRQKDLLRSYFRHAQPHAALPYVKYVPHSWFTDFLLHGTELYVLAHEVAHILLGHLSSERTDKKEEIAADSLALKIVSHYFSDKMDFPEARATLCATSFLEMNEMWEKAIIMAIKLDATSKTDGLDSILQDRISTEDDLEISKSHPSALERFDGLNNTLAEFESDGGETPDWYTHVHNAIRFAAGQVGGESIADVINEAGGVSGLSSQVLPASIAHNGHSRIAILEDIFPKSIAELITSTELTDQIMGRWFLVQLSPYSAFGLYDGVKYEEGHSKVFENALIAIEPLYKSYIPRLKERFDETAREDQDYQFRTNISSYLTAMASVALGEERAQGDPMDMGFFEKGL